MEDHFKGIVPEERWKNELLEELREIRKILEGNVQTFQQQVQQDKQKSGRRSVK